MLRESSRPTLPLIIIGMKYKFSARRIDAKVVYLTPKIARFESDDVNNSMCGAFQIHWLKWAVGILFVR
jgi:hypothetical protein